MSHTVENIATDLAAKTCVPCKGGVPPLDEKEREKLLKQIPEWRIVDEHHLSKTYSFKDFAQPLALVNKIGAVAEEQNHHPDIFLSWGKVRVDIWTHKIDNLTESDFILAAKIEELAR